MNKQNIRIILVIVIVAGFIMLGIFILDLISKNNINNKKPLPVSNLQIDENQNIYGIAYVAGYPIIEKVLEPFCENNCKEYDYVFFEVLDTSSKVLLNFLNLNRDNSFVGDRQIGLGCVENDTIKYFNDSDEFGMKEYILDLDLSKNILNATEQNPIIIELERLKFTGGSGAPACYSHFTYVNQVF